VELNADFISKQNTPFVKRQYDRPTLLSLDSLIHTWEATACQQTRYYFTLTKSIAELRLASLASTAQTSHTSNAKEHAYRIHYMSQNFHNSIAVDNAPFPLTTKSTIRYDTIR